MSYWDFRDSHNKEEEDTSEERRPRSRAGFDWGSIPRNEWESISVDNNNSWDRNKSRDRSLSRHRSDWNRSKSRQRSKSKYRNVYYSNSWAPWPVPNAESGASGSKAPASNAESGDWNCKDCGISNFSTRAVCRSCKKKRSNESNEPGVGGRYYQTKSGERGYDDRMKNNQPRCEDWNCPNCGFYNFNWRPFCRDCKTSKINSEKTNTGRSNEGETPWRKTDRPNEENGKYGKYGIKITSWGPTDRSNEANKAKTPYRAAPKSNEENEENEAKPWRNGNRMQPDKNWICSKCRVLNNSGDTMCYNCKVLNQSTSDDYSQDGTQKEAKDPSVGSFKVNSTGYPSYYIPYDQNSQGEQFQANFQFKGSIRREVPQPRMPEPVPAAKVKIEEKEKPILSEEREKQTMETANALKVIGDLHYKKGENQQAIRFYSRAIALYPQNYVYFLNRTAALVKLDSFLGFHLALHDCEHVQKLKPGNIKAISRTIVCAAALGKFRKARVVLLQMAKLKPTFWMEDEISMCDFKPLNAETLNEINFEGSISINKVVMEKFTLLKTLDEHTEEAKKNLRTATTTVRNVSVTEIRDAISAGLNRITRVVELANKHKGLTLGTFSLDSNIGSFSLELAYLRCKFRYLAKEYDQIDKEVKGMCDKIRVSISPDSDDYRISSLTPHKHIAQLFNKRERRLLLHFSKTEVDMLMEMFKMQVQSNYHLMNFENVLNPWITEDCEDSITTNKFITDNSKTIFLKFLDGFPLAPDALDTFVNNKESSDILNLISLSAKLHFAKMSGNNEYALRNFKNAEEQYTHALGIDSKHSSYNSIIYYNRAAARRGLGNYKEAINDCTASIKLVPSYSKALLRRAESYDSTKRWTLAIADYKTYLESQTTSANASLVQEQMQKAQASLSSQLETVRNEYKKMSHYERLGLTGKPAISIIKKAYRKQAIKFHPDKAMEEDSAIVNERFVMINESYEILIKQ